MHVLTEPGVKALCVLLCAEAAAGHAVGVLCHICGAAGGSVHGLVAGRLCWRDALRAAPQDLAGHGHPGASPPTQATATPPAAPSVRCSARIRTNPASCMASSICTLQAGRLIMNSCGISWCTHALLRRAPGACCSPMLVRLVQADARLVSRQLHAVCMRHDDWPYRGCRPALHWGWPRLWQCASPRGAQTSQRSWCASYPMLAAWAYQLIASQQ